MEKINGKGVKYPENYVEVRADITEENHRLIVVGDVHGCFDELQELLTKCSSSARSITTGVGEHTAATESSSLKLSQGGNDAREERIDVLVLVGDLVHKGPKSLEVLRYAREVGALVVRGNKDDDAVVEYYNRQKEAESKGLGTTEGQRESAKETDFISRLTVKDVKYLESLPYVISLPHFSTLVVHTGLVPGLPLHQQDVNYLFKMRNIVQREDGLHPTESDHEGEPWAKLWKGPDHVYFGHDAPRGLQLYDYATGLDTACCCGFELTAVILPERRFVSVEARKKYTTLDKPVNPKLLKDLAS